MRQRFYVNWKYRLFFGISFLILFLSFFNAITILNILGFICGIITFAILGLLYVEVNDVGIGLGNLIRFKNKFYCFMEWSEVEELRCWGTSRTMIVICGNGKRIPIDNYSNVPKILKFVFENANPKETDQEILHMVKK